MLKAFSNSGRIIRIGEMMLLPEINSAGAVKCVTVWEFGLTDKADLYTDDYLLPIVAINIIQNIDNYFNWKLIDWRTGCLISSKEQFLDFYSEIQKLCKIKPAESTF